MPHEVYCCLDFMTGRGATQIHQTQNKSKVSSSFICFHMINVSQATSLPLGLHLFRREISEAIKCFGLFRDGCWRAFVKNRVFADNTVGARTLQHNTTAVTCPKCQGIQMILVFHPSFPVTVEG